MGFLEAVSTCFRKYATFTGRALRSEYWYFFLFYVLGSFVFGVVDGLVFGFEAADTELFGTTFGLAMILPMMSAATRRFHDTNRSGWRQMLPVVGLPVVFVAPMIGFIIALILYIVVVVQLCQAGNPDANDYGVAPGQDEVDVGVFD